MVVEFGMEEVEGMRKRRNITVRYGNHLIE